MVFQRSMLDWSIWKGARVNLYMKLIWCNGFQRSILDCVVHLANMSQCAVCSILNLCSVMVSRDLCLIGGGPSAKYEFTLTWVYVHSAIYETYLVYWFSRDLCSIGGGDGVSLS